MAAPTSEAQMNTAQLTQLLILNLGSRNACMRALIANPNDLNAAANWLIQHGTDANIDSDPFAAATTTTTTTAAITSATTTSVNRFTVPRPAAAPSPPSTSTPTTQQQMIQQVMNAGHSREEALRAYTNVSTNDRNDVSKLTQYLRQHPTNPSGPSSYSNSSWYPYANQNKKKVARPMIDIDAIEVDREEVCDIDACEPLQHICIMMREYKRFLLKMADDSQAIDATAMKDGADYEAHGFYAYFMEAISGEDDDEKYTLSDVMDDFLHVVAKHDTRYGELSRVRRMVLGADGMDGAIADEQLRVRILQRIRCCHDDCDKEAAQKETLRKYYFGFRSVKEISVQQLCDKMYVYLVHTYELAAKLGVDAYEALDQQLGVRTNAELHAEKLKQQPQEDGDALSTLVKEKDISWYVGHKQFVAYGQLLTAKRETAVELKHAQFTKFYGVLQVEALQTRVDPKELKTKLHKQRRAEREHKKREQQAVLKQQTLAAVVDKDKEKEKEKDKKDEPTPPAAATADATTSEHVSEPAASSVAAANDAAAVTPEPQALPASPPPKQSPASKPVVEHVHVDKKEFSLGVRFNYWAPELEDLIALSIAKTQAKHGDLQAELTQNAVCKLSAFEYAVLSEKSSIYLETTFKQGIEAGVNPFGIGLLAPIEKPHIMAVMVYCNYDALRTALCATFMRTSAEEADDAMIERHSHFYWLGKYLREAVECYGVEAHKSESKRFYHGVAHNTRIMQEDEIKSLFVYAPLSTTSCMEIALNHSSSSRRSSSDVDADDEKMTGNNDALILEIQGFVCKYFDCAWLSDLCYEQEKVFFGGDRSLTVNKCIDATFGYDHKLFLTAMKFVPNIFRAPISEWKINKHDDMLQETKDAIRNLLFYQLNQFGDNAANQKFPDNFGEHGVPTSQAQRLTQFCESTTEVRMHYDAMYNHRAYAFLSSLFMTPTRTFVELNVVRELFPNLTTFSLIRVPLTTLTFMYLKSVISPPNEEEGKDDHKDADGEGGGGGAKSQSRPLRRCPIGEFRLIDPKTDAMSIAQVIHAEEKSLAALQWTICSPDQVSLLLQYSDASVVLKEPTPPPVAVAPPPQEENKDDDSKTGNGADNAAKTEAAPTKKVVVKRIVKRVVRKKKSQANVSQAQTPTTTTAVTAQTESSQPADGQ